MAAYLSTEPPGLAGKPNRTSLVRHRVRPLCNPLPTCPTSFVPHPGRLDASCPKISTRRITNSYAVAAPAIGRAAGADNMPPRHGEAAMLRLIGGGALSLFLEIS